MTPVTGGEQSSDPVARSINIPAVTQWLDSEISAATPPFSFELIVGGHSNLTFKVTDADNQHFVLRRPPLGAVLATAHDMGREHKVISAVGKTAVPVPECLGLCDDPEVNGSPFYIMNYVEGTVLHDAEVADAALAGHDLRKTLSAAVVSVFRRS